MAITETPYSIRIEQGAEPDSSILSLEVSEEKVRKNRDNPKSDSSSLSFLIDGKKVTESQGQIIKRDVEITERHFQLKDEVGEKPVTYASSEHLDVLAFPAGLKNAPYVAQNGKYIEIGVLSQHGNKSAQYDKNTGNFLKAEVELDSLNHFEFPTQVDVTQMEMVKDTFVKLQKTQTPHPTNLYHAYEFICSNIQLKESSLQQPLFEI